VQQHLFAPQPLLAHQTLRDLGDAIVAHGDDHRIRRGQRRRELAAAGRRARDRDARARQARGQRRADDAGAHDEDHRTRHHRRVGRRDGAHAGWRAPNRPCARM
jgi:hypothetical protein